VMAIKRMRVLQHLDVIQTVHQGAPEAVQLPDA
jgi:hypothetical protein